MVTGVTCRLICRADSALEQQAGWDVAKLSLALCRGRIAVAAVRGGTSACSAASSDTWNWVSSSEPGHGLEGKRKRRKCALYF